MILLERVILPVELTNSNDGRGHAFWRTAKERRDLELILADFRRKTPYAHPVTVTVTRILGKGQRLWDSSSVLRGNWKEIEDTLVELGWFMDDGPKWIAHTAGFQDVTRRDAGPAVEVAIWSKNPSSEG